MFGFISRNVLTGIITILPVFLTFYLLYWMAVTAESMLGGVIRATMPEEMYWPGMGVIAGLAVLFIIGMLMHAYIVRTVFSKFEALFSNMPVVKPIYRAMKDFFDYFSPKKEQEFDQVVSVTFNGMKLVGFITQNDSNKLPQGFNDEESILVYLPLSYMIGGYAVLVPRSAVEPVDMTMEEAMRFTLTAGVASTSNHKPVKKTKKPEEVR
ncbi:DUF502 domain-containing protein [Thiomicrorhabdus sp. ZW0627]|uniref:DUF502 domain-containing protein n=1 Tax=Thiomicrorhabdus sp. ZW0627 TaxID=3039774 RepID=UPI0024366CDF|nr:DUF502 domain-containing protein [Thiomicrorhabdus sp. ZW0627]